MDKNIVIKKKNKRNLNNIINSVINKQIYMAYKLEIEPFYIPQYKEGRGRWSYL